jgi:hypothetical protein
MILFFSGSTSGESLPERVLYEHSPGVMLTYFEMHQKRGDTIRRFERHARKRKKMLKKRKRRESKAES